MVASSMRGPGSTKAWDRTATELGPPPASKYAEEPDGRFALEPVACGGGVGLSAAAPSSRQSTLSRWLPSHRRRPRHMSCWNVLRRSRRPAARQTCDPEWPRAALSVTRPPAASSRSSTARDRPLPDQVQHAAGQLLIEGVKGRVVVRCDASHHSVCSGQIVVEARRAPHTHAQISRGARRCPSGHAFRRRGGGLDGLSSRAPAPECHRRRLLLSPLPGT